MSEIPIDEFVIKLKENMQGQTRLLADAIKILEKRIKALEEKTDGH